MSNQTPSKPRFQAGKLVEFSDAPHNHWPPANASLQRYGLILESTNTYPIRVMTAKGECLVRYVHAYAWAGWVPEELEEIVCQWQYEHEPRRGYMDDELDYYEPQA